MTGCGDQIPTAVVSFQQSQIRCRAAEHRARVAPRKISPFVCCLCCCPSRSSTGRGGHVSTEDCVETGGAASRVRMWNWRIFFLSTPGPGRIRERRSPRPRETGSEVVRGRKRQSEAMKDAKGNPGKRRRKGSALPPTADLRVSMSGFMAISSALPPKADIKMGAALRLLVTQSGHYQLSSPQQSESEHQCSLDDQACTENR